jgi:hypothetical protein
MQEDGEFEAILGNIARPCLKEKMSIYGLVFGSI